MTATELRQALRALGLTQRFLARELGVHAVTVSRWCSDNRADALAVPRYVSAYLAKCAEVQSCRV